MMQQHNKLLLLLAQAWYRLILSQLELFRPDQRTKCNFLLKEHHLQLKWLVDRSSQFDLLQLDLECLS
jgi:hypothetical protein